MCTFKTGKEIGSSAHIYKKKKKKEFPQFPVTVS